MKKILFLSLSLVFTSFIFGQIDRSVQPKPGPAPEIKIKNPKVFTLKNGLQVLVVENHKLPIVSVSLLIDNPPLAEGDKAGVSQLMGSLLGTGSVNISKEEYENKIDFLGADVNFHSSGAWSQTLSKYLPEVFGLMTDAFLHPDFTQEEFDKVVDKTLEELKSGEKSVASVARRVRSAVAYGKKHPYGEFQTEETITNITLDDVKSYYESYFKPNNAYLIVMGDVSFKKVKKLITKTLSDWEAGDLSSPDLETPKNVSKTEIDFVNMPNAVQSEISVVYNVSIKMSDPDYHAVLVANQILGGDFNSYLNMNLREEHGFTYGARSRVKVDKYASLFSTGVSVRNSVTDSAVVETMKEINRIRTEKVDEDRLKDVKASYVGDFVRSMEENTTIARYALNIKTNDLPEDFYATFLQKINAVTADDILRVAKKYFGYGDVRIVVVGKAIDVLPALDKLPYTINYFDKYANPTAKPELMKQAPEGVTVETIINDYVKAIGGKEKVDAVNTVKQVMEAEVQGQKLKMTVKTKKPNKESMEIEMMGMVMQRGAFNGETGYNEARGQKMPLTDEEIEEKKKEILPFSELGLLDSGELLGVEMVDGVSCYVIKDGDSKIYFNTENGLMIQKVDSQTDGEGNVTSQRLEFSDYQEVDGVLFPFQMKTKMGPMDIVFKVIEIKVNAEVEDKDFD